MPVAMRQPSLFTGFQPPPVMGRRMPTSTDTEAADEAPPAGGWAAGKLEVQDGTIEAKGVIRFRVFPRDEPDDKTKSYAVFSVKIDGEKAEQSLKVTSAIWPKVGERFVARGRWGHFRGKTQFQAETIQVEVTRNVQGIAQWMKGAEIPGVGKVTQTALVKAAGDRLPDIIHDPEAILALGAKGITPAKASAIAHAWNANASNPELMSELLGYGLGPKQAAGIIATFGAKASDYAKTNPWKFLEVGGIGFQKVDPIGEANGLSPTDPNRLEAGLVWAMEHCVNAGGHTGMPRDNYERIAARLLRVSADIIHEAAGRYIADGLLVEDQETGLVYTPRMREVEREAATILSRLMDRALPTSQAVAAGLLEAAERELGVRLDRDGGQWEAALLAMTSPVCILTGGPGTGKSTVQGVIVRAMELNDGTIALGAPTGRAAKRLSETTKREGFTIHRLLEWSPSEGGFLRNEYKPLAQTTTIIDEFSMVDIRLFLDLIQAIKLGHKLIIVGDYDQLPSVGPGQVLRDLIESGVIPVARLTRVHRQAEGSGVAVAAAKMKQGLDPLDEQVSGFEMVEAEPEDVVREVLKLMRIVLPREGYDPVRDVQVVSPKKAGTNGVENLNMELKDALNPGEVGDGRTAQIGPMLLTVGDRVMQVENNYNKNVTNGEVGLVVSVTPGKGAKGTAVVNFGGPDIEYTERDIDQLTLAYAATVHKMQGCECPVIVMVTTEEHEFQLNRNLVYTADTRAKRECKVVGQARTLRAAVRKDGTRRHSGLMTRLRNLRGYEMAA